MSELKDNLDLILQEKNEKIIPENIKRKVEIFGVTGTDGNAEVEELQEEIERVQEEIELTRRDLEKVSCDVEGSGENVTLNGTAEATFKKAPLPEGNTKQTQLDGYNILDLEKYPYNSSETTLNGGTVTIKDGVITVDGTNATGTVTARSTNLPLENRSIIPAGTYYFGVRCNLRSVQDSEFMQANIGIQTLNEDYYFGQWFVPVGISNKIITPLIISKNSSKIDYEPYCGGTASPNPDYKQDIENVTGNANVKIQNKNLAILRNDLTSYGASVDTTIIRNDDTGKVISTLIPIKPNTIYTLYREKSTPVANTRCFYYDTFPVIDETISIGGNYINTGANLVLRITAPSTAKWLFVRWTSDNDTNPCGNVQILEGSYTDQTIPSYVPHQEQNYPFSLKSKNLFDIDNMLDGFLPSNGNYPINNSSYPDACYELIEFKAGKTYYISSFNTNKERETCSGGRIRFIDKDTNQVVNHIFSVDNEYFTSTGNYNGSIPNDGKITAKKDFFAGVMFLSKYYDKTRYFIQIEEGEATDYEPYYDIKAMQGTTLQDNGIHQKRKQIVLDGTENWTKTSDTVASVFVLTMQYYGKPKKYGNSGEGLSNYFKYQYLNKAGNFYFGINNIAIVMDTSYTLETFKEWLAKKYENGTPLIVEYEPEEEEIVPYEGIQQAQYDTIKKAISYSNVTHVSGSSDEADPIFNVIAYRDPDIAITNLENKIELLEN